MLSFLSDEMVTKETIRIFACLKSTVIKKQMTNVKATALKQPFQHSFKISSKTILKLSLINTLYQNLQETDQIIRWYSHFNHGIEDVDKRHH